MLPGPVLCHQLMTGDSNQFENGSDSTGSSGARKDHRYHSTLGSSFSDHGGYEKHSSYLPRTSSTVSTEEQEMDPAAILAALQSSSRPQGLHLRPNHHPRHHSHHHRHHRLPFTAHLSQESSDYMGHYSSSVPLSQSTAGHSSSYYKPSSPASSSDTSMTSSVMHRLGSGPASAASSSISLSQSTSSSGGYNYRLPRPRIGNGATLYPQQYPPLLEDRITGEPNRMGVPMGKGYSPEQDPRLMHIPVDVAQKLPDQVRRKVPQEAKAERDPFSVKLDMVMSVMSALSISSKSDADAVKLILALSQSSETCSVMSESNCIDHLVQILHKIQQKGSKEHAEIRFKAAEALRNIVRSNCGSRRGRSELAVLSSLEKVRNHCEKMFVFIYSYRGQNRHLDPMMLESLQKSCNDLMVTLRKLFKYSSDKELYRPAILSLGGLQAMAEILVVDYYLPMQPNNQKIITHSPDIIAITITTLINLTYGDPSSKLLLCSFPDFLHALISHMYSTEEAVLSKGAQVLRNLSCKASKDIKDALLKCNAVDALMAAIDNAEGETTTQHITSALWNISAHSIENRHHVCRSQNGISTLVCLLSYNSPSGATVVVENVGGILRNLSNVISLHEDYRKQFREAGGLAKLVQHLKSKNHTVLSNATGILWNLSARCPEDQKLLWDLGCVPLLDVLQTSPAKNVAENARAALRNLLAFGQSNSIGPLSSKMRRPHSKSRSTTTLPLSQSFGADYELQSGRRSAPYHSTTNAIYPSPMPPYHSTDKGMLRSRSEAGSRIVHRKINDEGSSSEEYTPKHSTLKFARVGSAPQPHNEEEWRNYRPDRGAGQDDFPDFKAKSHSPHHSHGNKKRTSKQVLSHRTRPGDPPSTHSLSQSGSYEMSSTSELQSMSVASCGLSPHLQMEHPAGQTEASVEYDDLDVELEYEDRYEHNRSDHMRGTAISSSPNHHPSEGEIEATDHFAAIAEAMSRPVDKRIAASAMPSPLHLPSHMQVMEDPKINNTDNLALDGTIHKERSEQSRGGTARQLSHLTSSKGHGQSPQANEMSTEL